MILVRHQPGTDGTHRVFLLGRLDRDDGPGLAAVADQLPPEARHVRFVTSRVWTDGPEAAGPLTALGRALDARAVPHSWVDCPPEVGAALTAAGLGERLAAVTPDDVRAGASWDGVLPLQAAAYTVRT